MDDVSKAERHRLLKKIMNEQEIGDQTRLLHELKKKGIKCTQATISRDLQELGVTKVRIKPGVYRYEVQGTVGRDVLRNKLKILFKNFVIDIKGTGNLLLIKTSPGNANGVANFIDRLEIKEILGTVAGDDTVLIILDKAANRKIIEGRFFALWEKASREI